jgi:tetratricopeptide (TPR) repeat protein
MFGIAGVFFGILVGWMLGSQQSRPAATTSAASEAAAPAAANQAQTKAPFDESRAAALKSKADSDKSDAATRVQLGDLYFDAERYSEAGTWYEAALAIDPRNVNASTDLGIVYYYMNQADRALAQFDRSLAIDPSHTKTLLNVGIVRAYGKQDLAGAAQAWQKIVDAAPDSPEARMARQGLESLRAAHPDSKPAPAGPDRSK